MWYQIKRVPWYGYVFSALFIFLDFLLYRCSGYVFKGWSHTWAIQPVIQDVDARIPLVPYFWVQVYILFKIPMFIAPLIVSTISREHLINYALAYISAQIIGFFFFCFVPSSMDRTNMPGIGNVFEFIKNKHGWSWDWLKWVYHKDSGAIGHNMFPSFHCVNAFFIWYGFFNRKEIKIYYRIGWLIMCILIMLSTMFVKQHYFFDVITAILLCSFTSALMYVINPGEKILKQRPNFLIIKKLNWNHEPIVARKTKIVNKENKK